MTLFKEASVKNVIGISENSCPFVVTNYKSNHEWTRINTNYYSFVNAKKDVYAVAFSG